MYLWDKKINLVIIMYICVKYVGILLWINSGSKNKYREYYRFFIFMCEIFVDEKLVNVGFMF